MKRIFINKKLTFLLVLLLMISLVLVLMLFTELAQLTSLNQKKQQLETLITQLEGEYQQSQELLEYLQSNEYLLEWAIEQGLLPADARGWIADNK